jgi:hypothetical protein
MFISSKDILQYVAWCITVHALIVLINDDISIYLFEDNSVAYLHIRGILDYRK